MKGRITLSALKKLPRTQKGQRRIFLWDDTVRKFGAYRTSTGDVVFVYQFRIHASHPTERLTIGKLGALTPDQARILAAAAALKVASGTNPIQERREALKKREVDESMLLKNFAAYYLKVRVEGKRRTAKDIRRTIEKDIVPSLGHLALSAIDIPKTEKLLNMLRQRSAGAARNAVIQLKAILNYAHAMGKIDRVAIKILKPEKSKKRRRMLQPREIRRFVEAAHDLGGPRGDAYLCLLRLIKRLEEIVAMRWDEVDLESRMWILPGDRSKNEDPQTIILPHQVIPILKRQQPDP